MLATVDDINDGSVFVTRLHAPPHIKSLTVELATDKFEKLSVAVGNVMSPGEDLVRALPPPLPPPRLSLLSLRLRCLRLLSLRLHLLRPLTPPATSTPALAPRRRLHSCRCCWRTDILHPPPPASAAPSMNLTHHHYHRYHYYLDHHNNDHLHLHRDLLLLHPLHPFTPSTPPPHHPSPLNPSPTTQVLLEDISDATILHTLRLRLDQKKIFTSIGPVLVVVNPYQPVEACGQKALARLTAEVPPPSPRPPAPARLAPPSPLHPPTPPVQPSPWRRPRT